MLSPAPQVPGLQPRPRVLCTAPARAAGQSVLGSGGEAAVLWCERGGRLTWNSCPQSRRGPWPPRRCLAEGPLHGASAEGCSVGAGFSCPTSRLLGRCRLPFRRWGLCGCSQVSTLCLGFLICKIRTRTGLPRRWSGQRESQGQSTQGGCSEALGLWARDPRWQPPHPSPQPRLRPSNGLWPDGGHGPVTLPLRVPSSSSGFTSEASPRACVPSL